jgi:hypothetical protein
LQGKNELAQFWVGSLYQNRIMLLLIFEQWVRSKNIIFWK